MNWLYLINWLRHFWGNIKNVETLDPPEGSYFPQAPKIRADDFTMIRIALALSFSNTH